MFVVNQQHPSDCRFEGYSTEALLERIVEFNTTSGLTAHDEWWKRQNVSGRFNEQNQVIYTDEPGLVPEPSITARLALFIDAGAGIQGELVWAAQGYRNE